MSGHSRWSTIKRKKGAIDQKRGKIFSKLIREVQVAARIGGGDLKGNPRLRDAIDECKAFNMPKDNIDRAIRRGTGELEGTQYDQVHYEGYGPGGVAVLIESLTDNKNRTVAEIRQILSRNGGALGEAGSVNWMFDTKGMVTLNKKDVTEDRLMEVALERGAEDIRGESKEFWEVLSDPSKHQLVVQALQEEKIPIVSSSVTSVPKNLIRLEGERAAQILKLIELLEDLDDVQKVYANFDIDETELERLIG